MSHPFQATNGLGRRDFLKRGAGASAGFILANQLMPVSLFAEGDIDLVSKESTWKYNKTISWTTTKNPAWNASQQEIIQDILDYIMSGVAYQDGRPSDIPPGWVQETPVGTTLVKPQASPGLYDSDSSHSNWSFTGPDANGRYTITSSMQLTISVKTWLNND